MLLRPFIGLLLFLSTPSARRATASRPNRRRRPRNFYPRPPRGGRPMDTVPSATSVRFLSTPSARRATRLRRSAGLLQAISIHALREEGDGDPRPDGYGKFISIHALREEGDIISEDTAAHGVEFLSTPSARRATAKTETKALFSNKLYNILHEFRRALIYNWSKSYPNHAK